ncbi:PP0621 family protein [Mycetohabitans sp. B46]|uniref:PP0621 family protein n=1 Tax=Mycetohabitans sp. B46 TaxID=2772536 RepID=UPI00307E59B2
MNRFLCAYSFVMARILFWLFVILAIQWLWRQLARRDRAPVSHGSEAGRESMHPQADRGRTEGAASTRCTGSAGGGALPEAIVRCAQCGVHVPVSETVWVKGQLFCSNEHAVRYAARPAGRDNAR